ncbi:hypothetical protein [Acidihalobacter ferrooxydans]|uniref:Uncharacterized protein n=1 Tax=Acidihalobacter ferrooxydans TaxID=1765967 RepID=A0A1P8UFA0_9GAMM|nr:hypothetical protein [Acidihalobacter ferrooxydans]APZ42530.1 hypothetical protein BW247_05010 [Acidihalobacter ferrooxydans]
MRTWAYYGGYHEHGGWLVHTIVSAIIHGIIYDAIFKLLRGVPAVDVVLIAVGVIAAIGFLWSVLR